MDAGPQTIEALFQSPKQQFVIPTFQRPYVWKEETQWEPLWEDVRNLVERYGDLLQSGKQHKEAQKLSGRHFLGAVVVQRLEQAFGGPEEWELIDGQQRLLTLQLMLDATQEVFEERGFEKPALELERIVLNDSRLCPGDSVFKLRPTGGDRDAFRVAMTNGVATDDHLNSQIVKAHNYFTVQVREWLDYATEFDANDRAQHLVVTLLVLLELVVIKLDGSDDAFVVFETLNARGTPLLAADLVKNYVLQMAVQQGHVKDDFHEKHWQEFEVYRQKPGEQPWWLVEIRQGRLFRPRLDVFLNHWLVMRCQEEVATRHLFSSFKKLVESTAPGDVETIVKNFVHVSHSYRELECWPENTPEGQFLYRWGVVQAGVLTPVLLLLFSASESTLPVIRRRRTLEMLESYLVRRMVCRLTTKDYNRLFLDLIGTMKSDLANADELVETFLLNQSSQSRMWPTDSEFKSAILSIPLYGRINQSRIRMVLEALEEVLRTEKTEDSHAPKNLQLEHVMPQSWKPHWPLAQVADPEAHLQAVQERDRIIHTLGNLTLVREKLNKTISNSPWSTKSQELQKHTTLHLNKWLIEQFATTTYDEAAIGTRGRFLATLACGVWTRRQEELSLT